MSTTIDIDWLKDYTMDAELRGNPLVQVWAEVFAEQVVTVLQAQLDDLSRLTSPEEVPQEWLPYLAENNGALWSDAAGWDNAREQVRHSLQVLRRAGSPRAVAIQFALADLQVTVGEIWLDRLFELPATEGGSGPLVQLVDILKFDEADAVFDVAGATFDGSTSRRFVVPTEHETEFADQFWGKTTFVTLNVIVRPEAPGRQPLLDTLVEQWMPVLLPVHCRLLGAQILGASYEDLRQEVGYWYGYGYGYSYEYGYAYGSWVFTRLGTIQWAQDSGTGSALLDDCELDDGVWDDGGWWDVATPQWCSYLTFDEGSWDDPDDVGVYDDI